MDSHQSASGHREVVLKFLLAPGDQPCTLTGYPGVDTGDGGPLLHAERTLSGFQGGLRTDRLPTVTVAADQPQYAVVEGVAVDKNDPYRQVPDVHGAPGHRTRYDRNLHCPSQNRHLRTSGTPDGIAVVTRTSLIALAVSTFCATVFGAPASAQPATPAAGCAELGGTVQADQTCHIETKTATYSIEISYPLGYSDQQAVTDFVDKDRNEFLDFITTLPPRDWPYEHGVRPHTFTSGTAASGTKASSSSCTATPVPIP